jgi:hypothetical protein
MGTPTQLTVAMWNKPTDVTVSQIFWAGENADGSGVYLQVVGSKFRVVGRDAGNSAVILESGAIVNNTLYHVAMTVTGTTMTLYLNGVSQGTAVVSNAKTCLLQNSMTWGVYIDGSSLPFNGRMADLMVWSTAHDSTHIGYLANAANPNIFDGTINLVGLFVSRNVDIVPQSVVTGYNAFPDLVVLKNQTGGNVARNGYVLVGEMTAASSNNGDNGGMELSTSTDNGATWSIAVLKAAVAHGNIVTSLAELANGTVLLGFEAPHNPEHTVYIAKSTDGGLTYSNLASPANTVTAGFTDFNAQYGRIRERTAGGDLWLSLYGTKSGDSKTRSVIMKCASGSDPTGANWSLLGGSIAAATVFGDGSTSAYNETAFIFTTDSNTLLAVGRNETDHKLYYTTGTASGDTVTWAAPAAITGAVSASVSPSLLKLANGNYLLSFGIRFGSAGGAGFMVWNGSSWSTIWQPAPEGVNSDGGYPSADILSNGNIISAYYYSGGGGTAVVASVSFDPAWLGTL